MFTIFVNWDIETGKGNSFFEQKLNAKKILDEKNKAIILTYLWLGQQKKY